MNITIYEAHKKQWDAHQSKARYRVLNWGRRTGKSMFAINELVVQAIQKPGRYWIVAPTYKQAKNIYWYDLMLRHVPKEIVLKKNEQELMIYLKVKDKDGIPSTIELKGADNEDSLRGAGVQGLVLDEYAFMSPSAWEVILRPMLVESGGWAVFISTPNGFNHFYDIATVSQTNKSGDWFYSHASMYDNPHIPKIEIDKIKDETNADRFAQEYMAEFKKKEGLVYSEFSKDIHVYDPMDNIEPDDNQSVFALTIDPGTSNPTAVLYVKIDYSDNWYIYDEIYQTTTNTPQLYRLIQTKMGQNYFTYRIADSAAAQFILDMNSVHNLGLYGVKKKKDSKEEGIKLIKNRLKVQEGTGKPKLFVSKHCTNTIWEFESYSYPEVDEYHQKNLSEDPTKLNDHAMDALRYLALMLFTPVEKPGQKFKRYRSEYTGRVLGYGDEDDRGFADISSII